MSNEIVAGKPMYTKGPWCCKTGHGNSGLAITGPDGEVLGSVRAFIPSGEIRHGMPVQMPWAEGMANAALIESTHDLLAACQKALYLLKGREHDQFLRDAISKALGEQA